MHPKGTSCFWLKVNWAILTCEQVEHPPSVCQIPWHVLGTLQGLKAIADESSVCDSGFIRDWGGMLVGTVGNKYR